MKSWDFDGDEVVFFLGAALIGLAGAWRWYAALLRCTSLRPSITDRSLLALTPAAGLAALGIVLACWSDPKYVVGHVDYQLLFLAGGAAWMWLIVASARLLGLSVTDDALGRSNRAATISICGALLGAMAIYAGGNIGSGPTIWTTIIPALVATVVWLLVWLLVELVSQPSEAIAVDRDKACALRHAGFLTASALILGRAVSGDWTGWRSTFSDLVTQGWPVLLFAIAAMAMNRAMQPTPKRPTRGAVRAGVVPGAILVLAAIGCVVSLGRPDIGKHVITYEQRMQSR